MTNKQIAEQQLSEKYGNLNSMSDSMFRIVWCSIYKTLRPVFKFIRPFLKIKKVWAIALEGAMILGDKACSIDQE